MFFLLSLNLELPLLNLLKLIIGVFDLCLDYGDLLLAVLLRAF